jgi:uncharacterized protein (TIGR02996 family)
MREDHGFLEAVRESPGDDLHRLAWADWLDEAGQADRAEHLRASVQACRLEPSDPQRAALEERADRLLDANEERWLGPLPEVALGWQWHKGCVERLTVRAADLLARGDEVLAAAPVHEMRILGTAADLAQLAAWPGLLRLGSLDLGVKPSPGEPGPSGFALRDIALDAFLSSPNLANVRHLRLSGHDFSNPLIGWMIERGWLGRLRTLDLSGCSSVGNGAARMLAAAEAPLLESLDLRRTNLSPPGAAPLLAASRWPRLARLALPFLLPQAEAASLSIEPSRLMAWQLQELFTLPPPDHLDLADASLTSASVQALALWPGLARVRALSLEDNRLTDTAARHLAASPHPRWLERLGLDGNRIGGPGLQALLSSHCSRGLVSLGLADNHVGRHGAGLLARLTPPRVTRLSLARSNIVPDALAELAASPLAGRLTSLRLDGNPISDEGLHALLAAGPLRLRELSLDYCGLGPGSVDLLCDRALLPHLRHVSARDGHFTNADRKRLRARFGAGWLSGDS